MSDLQGAIQTVEDCVKRYGDEVDWVEWLRLRARLEAQPDRQAVATAIDVAFKGTLLQAEAFDAADAAIAAIKGDTK